MALDNLDASIPLQAGNIQIGNPQQINAMLAMQMRMHCGSVAPSSGLKAELG